MLQLTNHRVPRGQGGVCWLHSGRRSRSSALITQVVAEGRVARSLERAPPTYHPPQQEEHNTSLPDSELFASAADSVDDGLLDYSVAWRMDELERLSAELLANLHELNAASEGVETVSVASREGSHEAAGTSAAAGSPASTSQKGRKRRKASAPGVTQETQAATSPAATKKKKQAASSPAATKKKQAEATPAATKKKKQADSPAAATKKKKQAESTPAAARQEQADTEQQEAGPTPQLGALLPAKPSKLSVTLPEQHRRSHAEKASTRIGAHGAVNAKAAAKLASEGNTHAKLLTREDEVELASIVKDALMLERVKGQLQHILQRPPTKDEWARAVGMEDPSVFAARLSMGQAAKAAMVSHNIRFVHHICKSYHNRGVHHEDLFTAGMQGLLLGVEKFDGKKGIKFSTYSYWWIRQALNKVIIRQSRIVGLPDHVVSDLRQIFSAETELREEQESDATLEQLAARLNMPAEKITALRGMAKSVSSLDVPTGRPGEGQGDELSVTLEDHRATPDDVLDVKMLQRDLQELLATGLTRREATVLRMRLILGVSLQEVSKVVGVCPERVRQIEKRAVAVLRRRRGCEIEEYSSQQAPERAAPRASMGTNKS